MIGLGIERTSGATTDPRLLELVDQLARKLQAGQPQELEAIVAAHPQYAEQLRQCLPTIQALAELANSIDSGSSDSADPQDTLSGVLGDFRIHREIGRGGMGVVYEAEQISLKRRVALKVLPFAAALDPRQLQRFKNEAQAAAHLHHTNIVPVFAVGCERGVHYYAMQLIEGQSLAQALDEMLASSSPLPAAGEGSKVRGSASTLSSLLTPHSSPRTRKDYIRRVVELGIQAAEALDYAHEMGVLHRDIKPANLLLDIQGNLWITDFGLAQIQSGSQLTMTGDLIGTLRYMSPEQALAKRVIVDHRTDIYSLGATLYELLTHRPVFEGTDRQELLHQIVFEDPVAPRKLDSSIPVDLETIVLKCLEKREVDRYPSCKDLANDLSKHLVGRPIQARRPQLVDRMRRFARRHTSLAIAASFVAAAIGVASMVGTLMIWEAQRETKQALRLATSNLKTAERNAAHSRTNFRRAVAAIDEMLDVLREDRELQRLPQTRAVTTALIARASNLYRGYLQPESTDPAIRYETALALLGMERILAIQLRAKEAENSVRQALDLLQALITDEPGNADYRKERARATCRLADYLMPSGFNTPESVRRLALAQDNYLRALAELEGLSASDPSRADFRLEIAHCVNGLSDVQFYPRPGDPRRGQYLRQLVAVREQLMRDFPLDAQCSKDLGAANNLLASWMRFHDSDAERESTLLKAVAIHERLAAESPAELWRVADSAAKLAGFYVETGRTKEGESRYFSAVDMYKQWVRALPPPPWPRMPNEPSLYATVSSMFHTCNSLANVLESNGRIELAEAMHCDALAELDRITRVTTDALDHDFVANSQAGQAFQLAQFYDRQLRTSDAEMYVRRSIDLWRSGVNSDKRLSASVWLAHMLARSGHLDEAESALKSAAALPEDWAAPKASGDCRVIAANAWLDLGARFHADGNASRAEQACDAAAALVNSLDPVPKRRLVRTAVPRRDYAENSPNAHLYIAITRFDLGALLAMLGHEDAARDEWHAAARFQITKDWWMPELGRDLAWRFASAPYADARNPDYAMKLASQALEHCDKALARPRVMPSGKADPFADKLTSARKSTLVAFALAQYRNADWNACLATLKSFMDSEAGQTPYDWIIAAMACSQLGQEQEARIWRDKALAWMKTNEPAEKDLRVLCVEAEKLISARTE